MCDRIIWKYLEELPEQEAPWVEWNSRLAKWHRFNTFYTHYLRVEDRRVMRLNCPSPCEQGYPRQVVENSPSDIKAVCPQNQADPIQLKFRDILIYSLRREVLHLSICVSLQVEHPSGNRWAEFGSTWYLGDYYDSESKRYYPVYLTYRAVTLPEAISSLCQLHHAPFVLVTLTGYGLMPEVEQLSTKHNFILLSLADELSLQPDGSFKPERSISECMKSYNPFRTQSRQNIMLPIDTYKYLVYNDL